MINNLGTCRAKMQWIGICRWNEQLTVKKLCFKMSDLWVMMIRRSTAISRVSIVWYSKAAQVMAKAWIWMYGCCSFCHSLWTCSPVLRFSRSPVLRFSSQVLLFPEPWFQGEPLLLEDSTASLPDGFRLSSCKVLSGRWERNHKARPHIDSKLLIKIIDWDWDSKHP